ncbi:MAG: hypothetical protein EXR94_00475 [Gemmatimonadetes bacterium]|nr:hypothetical protein [Gemmatimonadota bacterium]
MAALVAVLAIWVWAPAQGLVMVWGAAIPLVAVSLFVTPVAWRGVCPLATLNEFGNRWRVAEPPSPALQQALGVAGLVLFPVLAGGVLSVALVGFVGWWLRRALRSPRPA